MTRKLLSSVAFLSIFLAVPTVNSAETPVDVSQMLTLNRLSAETKAFLDSGNVDSKSVHSLSTEKPEKAYVSVNIDGKTYYFTPSGEENKGKLQTLANIGAAALVKLDKADGAIYSIAEDGKDTVYYGYQAENLPVSGYSLKEITKEEAETTNSLVITKYAENEDGSLSEKYFRVIFNDGVNVKWQDISEGDIGAGIANSGVIAVENANNEVKYYRYSYTLPDSEGRTVYTERQESVGNEVNADFIGNYVESYERAVGGAISNSGKISSIVGDFVSNYLQTVRGGWGGAINNSGTIDNIKGNFINNFIEHMEGVATAQGGAINNTGKIGVITGNFIGNYLRVFPSSHTFLGGAIYNSGTIREIIGNFIGNSVNSTCMAFGGAIYNDGIIGNITGDFVGNTVKLENGESYAEYEPRGGAIYNDGGTIGNITGDFISNSADSMIDDKASRGGAINNYMGTVGDITGNFVKNFAKSKNGSAVGGAIFSRSQSTIGDITGDFVENTVQSTSGNAFGGAIYNTGETDNITGDFINNLAVSARGTAVGGAIFNGGAIEAIVNSNFINNTASGNEDSVGGAIYSSADLNIVADAGESRFAGNTVNGKSNAIYMDEVNLNLSAVNNGVITFDDGIDGWAYDKETDKGYDINVSGDGTGVVKFNNLVENVRNFTMSEGSKVHLGVNAKIQAENMSDLSVMKMAGRSASGSPLITVDVEVNKAENKVNSGEIYISGDIVGNYAVLVNALNPDVLDNLDDAVVPFLFAPVDNPDTLSSFNVARVVGSPYMWDGKVNAKSEQTGSTWYLNLTDEPNPDYKEEKPDDGDDKPNTGEDKPSQPIYAPEVAAYVGLQGAALAQNRSVSDSVMKGLAYRKSLNCYQESCGVSELLPQRQAWIDVTHENAEIDTPAEMDAKINGTTFGFDLFREGAHRGGLFGSYRYGKYDLSGKGKYYAASESDITSKSYLGGAYYQYDDSTWRLTGMLFAGNQDMTIKTEDKIARATTDAAQYGASVETAKRYEVSDNVNLEPSLGLYYTMLDVDNLQDNVGKSASFDTLHYLEAEAGVKIEREVCHDGKTNRLYAKPSVIRTFSEGARTEISGFSHGVKSYKDATLGRLEVGGEFDFGGSWNGYAHTGYTFGNDYKAYDLSVGISRRF